MENKNHSDQETFPRQGPVLLEEVEMATNGLDMELSGKKRATRNNPRQKPCTVTFAASCAAIPQAPKSRSSAQRAAVCRADFQAPEESAECKMHHLLFAVGTAPLSHCPDMACSRYRNKRVVGGRRAQKNSQHIK